MLIGEEGDKLYYKAGIFLCAGTCVDKYKNVEEYWTRSFYAFIENLQTGDLFKKSIPYIKWEEVSTESFRRETLKLLTEYRLESFSLEGQKEEEIFETLQCIDLSQSVSVIDDFVTSSVAMSKNTYVSFFSLDKDLALKSKWHRTS